MDFIQWFIQKKDISSDTIQSAKEVFSAYCAKENLDYSTHSYIIPVLYRIAQKLSEDNVLIVRIDGRAASGKTTLANILSKITGADIIHMDDFFLPQKLKTKERLTEAGGNIHYERFQTEILPNLNKKDPFIYPVFDCKQQQLSTVQTVLSKYIRIIEGVYSFHPLLRQSNDLKIFMDIDPEMQKKRIHKRNPGPLENKFLTDWIPLEEKYFKELKIKDTADILLTTPETKH